MFVYMLGRTDLQLDKFKYVLLQVSQLVIAIRVPAFPTPIWVHSESYLDYLHMNMSGLLTVRRVVYLSVTKSSGVR